MKKITKILSAIVLVFACFAGVFSLSGCTDKKISSIGLSTEIKTEYKIGESLDLNGAKLVLTYDDDSQNELTISSDWITGFNTETVGERTLTITYKGKTIEQAYKVVKTLESISLNGTIKTEYKLYDELDLNNAKITLNYDNDTTEDVVLTSQMVTGFNTETVGEKTLTITYEGKSLTVDYSVSEIDISALLTTAYNNTINSEMLKVSTAQTISGITANSQFIKNNNIFQLIDVFVTGMSESGYICLSPFKTTLEDCYTTTNEEVFNSYDQGAMLVSGISTGTISADLTITKENGKLKITGTIVMSGQSQVSLTQVEILISSDKFIESINVVVNNSDIDTTTTTITYSYSQVPQISYPED